MGGRDVRDGEWVKEERRVGLLIGEAGSEDVRDRFGEVVASTAVKTLRSESAIFPEKCCMVQRGFSLDSCPCIQGKNGGREGRVLRRKQKIVT